jgi:hypothetical protein
VRGLLRARTNWEEADALVRSASDSQEVTKSTKLLCTNVPTV